MQSISMWKIQRKILLEDDLAMIFIDFGLLHSLYCQISYLLAEEHKFGYLTTYIWLSVRGLLKISNHIRHRCNKR